MAITDFSAKEPSLGYYYQIRLSLYLLLKAKDKQNAVIRIECLDDIVIDDVSGTNLYQTKLHINSITDLTNFSPDFWKTIRVWSENILSGQVDLATTLFTLITTAKIHDDSFLKEFKETSTRANKKILENMLLVISTSTNNSIKPAFEAFAKLSESQQLRLISNIYILDAGLSINEALNAIKSELILSCTPKQMDPLVERLEGWWFQNVIESLQDYKTLGISFKDLQLKVNDIAASFQEENLPDDFADPLQIDETELDNYEDKVFIKQLKLVAAKSNILRSAISDFRRAYEQRSKWLREELASLDEMEVFEKKLFDHWNNIFLAMKDDGDGLDEEELKRLGMNFYRKFYVDTCPPVRIRSKFQSEYLTRGSCHILSDSKKIGWHPDFPNRLN